MSRSEWELNGDSIRFSETGVLLDGQHRLAAIIKSGVSIETLVVTGLPDSVFDVIDVGARRSAGDVLDIRGYKNYNTVAAAAKMYFVWEAHGNPFHGTAPSSRPTIRQIEHVVDENPGLKEAVKLATASRWAKKYITPGMGAFCFYVFGQSAYADCVESFYGVLDTGIATMKKDAAFLLRDMLMEDKTLAGKRKMSQKYKCALIFKAFKKHATREPSVLLRISIGGPKPEKELFELPMNQV